MNTLAQVLSNLCDGRELGALVITKDGMLIESHISDDYQADTIGAFMSQVALVIKSSLQEMGHDSFTRYILESNQGKVYLVDLGKSVLIALAPSEADPSEMNIALFQAANEIKKTGRLDI